MTHLQTNAPRIAKVQTPAASHKPSQSSWCLLGSWINFQCKDLAFSESNFWRQSGHWKPPVILTPTFSTLPSPDFAASEISMVSGIPRSSKSQVLSQNNRHGARRLE